MICCLQNNITNLINTIMEFLTLYQFILLHSNSIESNYFWLYYLDLYIGLLVTWTKLNRNLLTLDTINKYLQLVQFITWRPYLN